MTGVIVLLASEVYAFHRMILPALGTLNVNSLVSSGSVSTTVYRKLPSALVLVLVAVYEYAIVISP